MQTVQRCVISFVSFYFSFNFADVFSIKYVFKRVNLSDQKMMEYKRPL